MSGLGPFASDRRVVAAVSGGADSMALARLLSRWGKPLACIVDHGLRPESAAEAARTLERLAGIGVCARVMQARLQQGAAVAERARAARYALLLQACRDSGCPDLVVAHHQDDQAETIRMRADAGSGPRGLSGMAAVTFLESARLLRPLLNVSSHRLRATLVEAGLGWEEDPTNRDHRTLRARLRLTSNAENTDAALQRAAALGAARRGAELPLSVELAAVALHPEGFAIAPERLGGEALSALIWTLSGRPYPPPRAALGRGEPQTIHGVLIRRAGRLGQGWLLAREPIAVGPPVPACAGVVWDGRFRLAGTPPPGLSLGALGRDTPRFRGRSPLPSIVIETLPTLRRDKDIVAVPHLCFPDDATCRSLPVWFCPTRPVAGAPFMPPVNSAERSGDA